jgi:hypothetical protein
MDLGSYFRSLYSAIRSSLDRLSLGLSETYDKIMVFQKRKKCYSHRTKDRQTVLDLV